ncbi:MAG: PilZ domain-containing protein [Myxococcaceae bacterium]|nr:PilZ domain-containing protein [Myxococcaceae bacterium]MCI0668939.1 PilZ domain-containing protein [Myxococcaceae bacterium]
MHSTSAASDTRYHPRVEAGFMVKVLRNDRTLLYRTRDLSMAGVFVEDLRVLPGQLVALVLPLPHDCDVRVEATARRLTDEGVALEFNDLDWDDMFALARFLYPRLP